MYKVLITRIEEKMVPTRDYEQVGTKSDGEAEYGYVHGEKMDTVRTDIFEQTVEILDVESVVAVINNLKK